MERKSYVSVFINDGSQLTTGGVPRRRYSVRAGCFDRATFVVSGDGCLYDMLRDATREQLPRVIAIIISGTGSPDYEVSDACRNALNRWFDNLSDGMRLELSYFLPSRVTAAVDTFDSRKAEKFNRMLCRTVEPEEAKQTVDISSALSLIGGAS